jgi:hypothetical protein
MFNFRIMEHHTNYKQVSRAGKVESWSVNPGFGACKILLGISSNEQGSADAEIWAAFQLARGFRAGRRWSATWRVYAQSNLDAICRNGLMRADVAFS